MNNPSNTTHVGHILNKEDLIHYALHYFVWPDDENMTYDMVRLTPVGLAIRTGHLRTLADVANFEVAPRLPVLYEPAIDPRPILTVSDLITRLRNLPGDMRVIISVDGLNPDAAALPLGGAASPAHRAGFDPYSGSFKVAS